MASDLSDDQTAFIQTYTPLAQDVSHATGLDSSVVLGQIAQETGWGKHVLGNNIFGISPVGPGGKQVVSAYPDVQTAASQYVNLIRSRYAGAASEQTPDAQANAIAQGGYNKNPAYGPTVAGLASTIRRALPSIAVGRPADTDMAATWGAGGAPSPLAAAARPSDGDLAKAWGASPSLPAATVTAPNTTAAPGTVPSTGATGAPIQPDYTGWDQPTATASLAKNYITTAPGVNGLTSYANLSNALASAPNTTYGSVLPIARDNATGQLRMAMPQSWRDLAQGGVDLAYSPMMGAITPKATTALGTVAGQLMPSVAAGTGAAIAQEANPLLSREFRANPGVTSPQFQPSVPGDTLPNPIASRSAPGVTNPLNSAASASPMTPAEQAVYDAIPEKLPPAPVFPPVTKSGAEARADQLIQHFAASKQVPETQDLVPGYTPTLAQVTNDPGIATLERGVQAVNPEPFGLVRQRNAKAVLDFTNKLTGTPEDVAALSDAREASTAALRDAAFTNKEPVDAAPVSDLINTVLSGPDGKRTAVRDTLTKVQDALVDTDGALETDPEMLYGVRKHINDLLTPAAQRDNPQLQRAAGQLAQVRGALDDVIESGAPGFKNYIGEYAKQSEPIDAMKYLQGLNLTDTAGNVRIQPVDAAIKGIQRMQKMPGIQKSSSVTDDQLAALNTLRNTLRAQQFSDTAGKAVGSNTFQNLATNSRVGSATGNPLVSIGLAGLGGLAGGPLGSMAGAGVNMAAHGLVGNAESMVKQAMIERLLNLQGKGVAALRSGVP